MANRGFTDTRSFIVASTHVHIQLSHSLSHNHSLSIRSLKILEKNKSRACPRYFINGVKEDRKTESQYRRLTTALKLAVGIQHLQPRPRYSWHLKSTNHTSTITLNWNSQIPVQATAWTQLQCPSLGPGTFTEEDAEIAKIDNILRLFLDRRERMHTSTPSIVVASTRPVADPKEWGKVEIPVLDKARVITHQGRAHSQRQLGSTWWVNGE